MGHRALVVYEREEGLDCHDAHWGGTDWRLVDTITPQTPYGTGDGGPGSVEPTLVWRAPSFEGVLARLDFQLYEALYRVGRATAVDPFLVCWFGRPCRDDAPGDGALVSVDPAAATVDGERLRGWFDGSKGALCEAIERTGLTPAAAKRVLAARVASRRATGRTVHFGPAATRPKER